MSWTWPSSWQSIRQDANASADVYYYRGLSLVAMGDIFGAQEDLQTAANRYLANGQADGYRAVLEKISQL